MHALIRFLAISAGFESSLVLYVIRKLALCLFFLTGAWMLYSAFHAKHFHYRGGRLMPLWLGRLTSFLAGIFVMSVAVYLWNR